MIWDLARLIALVVVLAIVVIGLVLQGWRYSREWEKNRYFAFIAKVTESYGFFCFLTIINWPVAIFATLVGQLMILFQGRPAQRQISEEAAARSG